jgi:hypothetical protein
VCENCALQYYGSAAPALRAAAEPLPNSAQTTASRLERAPRCAVPRWGSGYRRPPLVSNSARPVRYGLNNSSGLRQRWGGGQLSTPRGLGGRIQQVGAASSWRTRHALYFHRPKIDARDQASAAVALHPTAQFAPPNNKPPEPVDAPVQARRRGGMAPTMLNSADASAATAVGEKKEKLEARASERASGAEARAARGTDSPESDGATPPASSDSDEDD